MEELNPETTQVVESKEEYTVYIGLANGVKIPMSIKAAETLAEELNRITKEAKEQGYE